MTKQEFQNFLTVHYDRLLRIAKKIDKNNPTARDKGYDLLLDTIVGMYDKQSYQTCPRRGFTKWFSTVMKNRYINSLELHANNGKVSLEEAESMPCEVADRLDNMVYLKGIWKKLPREIQQFLWAVEVEGVTIKEYYYSHGLEGGYSNFRTRIKQALHQAIERGVQ